MARRARMRGGMAGEGDDDMMDDVDTEGVLDNPELDASFSFGIGGFPILGEPGTRPFWVGLIVILAALYIAGVRIGFRGVVHS